MSSTFDPSIPNENAGPAILGATLSTLLVAFVIFVIRMIVRVKITRSLGWDDYLMCAAMALAIAIQAVIIPEVHYGAGRHKQYIDPDDFIMAMKLNFISQPLCIFGPLFIKLSTGFLLLRIAGTRFFIILISTIMALLTVYTIACLFTIIFACTDIRVQWDPAIEATCWSASTLQSLSYANQTISIFTDLLFAIFIPIAMLWNVQLNKRTKASIICILGLGLFATSAAIIRSVYLRSYGLKGDWMWDSRNITTWATLEINIGILASSLPTLKPLFRRVLKTYSQDASATDGKYSHSQSRLSHMANKYSNLGSKNTSTTNKSKGNREYTREDGIIMTNISAGAKGVYENSDTESKRSDESITRLNREIGGQGITKTTMVATTIDVSPIAMDTDKESRDGLAPEMTVEDRV